MADLFNGAELTENCRALCESSAVITIDADAAAAFAAQLDLKEVRQKPPAAPANSDEDEERSAALLIAWNAINFSYYPDDGKMRWHWQASDGSEHGVDDEANGVVAALITLNSGKEMRLADPSFLSSVSASAVRETIFKPAPGAGELPLSEERAAALRELGDGLARLRCTPRGLVQSAGGSAARFVATLCREFPLYSDVQNDPTASAPHTTLAFHKRAQLCASMLHGRAVCGGFTDPEALTVFADYRVPQLFRASDVGVLSLAPRLATLIDDATPIARGSEDEVSIRAATIWAAALVGDALRKRGGAGDITQAQLDYFLWRTAVKRDVAGELPAFHRTRCTAY